LPSQKRPKYIQQTTFETRKPCFVIAYLGEKLINLLKQNVAIIFGYFILSKNRNESPKVAKLVKNAQSGHSVV
jgi:hypothetical protein